MRTQLAAIVLLAAPSLALAADWQTIKPQATTEAQLIAEFGPPDEVRSTVAWAEWSAKWKKRPVASHYVLRYTRQRSTSALLLGPGGPADDVEAFVANGRVIAVTWHYGGAAARAAGSKLRADPDMKMSAPASMAKGSRSTAGGVISAELASDDTRVEVRLELK